MSLTTKVALNRPVNIDKLWPHLRELIGASESVLDVITVSEDFVSLETLCGSGLPAHVTYVTLCYGESVVIVDDEELSHKQPWGNRACVVVLLDTTYSSTSKPHDFHAWLVSEIYDWIVRGTNSEMVWYHKDKGVWHKGSANLSDLGDIRRGASYRSA